MIRLLLSAMSGIPIEESRPVQIESQIVDMNNLLEVLEMWQQKFGSSARISKISKQLQEVRDQTELQWIENQ
jgi:hypothetical protein